MQNTFIPIREFVQDCNPCLYRSLKIPLFEEYGCLFGESGASSSLLNGVIRCSLKDSQVDIAVEKIFQYFQGRKLPHSWWTEISSEPSSLKMALEKKGLHLAGIFPSMAVDYVYCQPTDKPNDLSIEMVLNEQDLKNWTHVIVEAFELSPSISSLYASLFQKAGLHGPFFHLVGKKAGKVVSTGSVLCTPHGAYIYNIATLKEERNQGFASNITYALLQLAKERNCTRTALIASPMAISLFKHIGFEEISLQHIYA